MSRDRREVELVVAAEATGGDAVRTLASQIEQLAEQGGEAAPQFQRLAEELRKIENQQGLITSFTRLKTESGDAARALDDAQRRAQALGREFAATENPSRKLTAEFNRAKREVGQAKEALDSKRLALQNVRGEMTQAGIGTKNLAQTQAQLRTAASDTAAEFLRVQTSAQQNRQGLNDYGQSARDASRDVKQLGADSASLGDRLHQVRGNVLAATAALSAVTLVIGNAAKESAQFGKSMAEVSTLLDDTSSMDELTASVRALSREFGGDVNDNAKALYDIISAGASDAAQATEILTAANKLAVGGVTDVATAADGLTSILNAYGERAGDVGNVSDALFTAMRGGKTTIDELSGSIGSVAPLAATAGVGLEELLAATAAITTGGVETSEAVTQLRGVLTAIIKPTKEAADTASELGIDFSTAALESNGLAGFLADVEDKAGGSTDAMAKLFGNVRALNGVLALAGNQADKFGEIVEQMGDKAGATEEAVGKMMDTPAARSARFAAALHDVRLSLGEAVTAFSPLLEAATKALNLFNELPAPMRATAAGVAMLAAGVPAVTLAVRQLSIAWAVLTRETVASTAATTASTAAIRANGVAATTTATQVGALAAAKRGLAGATGLVAAGLGKLGPILRGLGWTAIAFEVVDVTRNLLALRNEINHHNDALAALQDNQQRAAERYRQVSEATGVAITSMADLDAAIASGRIQFDEATASWVAGGAALADVAEQADAAALSTEELAKREWGAQVRQSAELAAKLEEAAASGKNAAGAVAEVLSGIGQLDGGNAVTVARALDMLKASGSEAADIVEKELVAALDKLDPAALEAVGDELGRAFEKGELAAQAFGHMIDILADQHAARVEDAFRSLGITSQRTLDQAADNAAQAWQRIRDSGTATAHDLERAFAAYARVVVQANHGVVTEALRAEAAMLGLKIEADQTGRVIVQAMSAAAGATGAVGDEADRAAGKVRNLRNELQNLSSPQGPGGGGSGPAPDEVVRSGYAGFPGLEELYAMYAKAEQLGGRQLKDDLERIYKETFRGRTTMSWSKCFELVSKALGDMQDRLEWFEKKQQAESSAQPLEAVTPRAEQPEPSSEAQRARGGGVSTIRHEVVVKMPRGERTIQTASEKDSAQL